MSLGLFQPEASEFSYPAQQPNDYSNQLYQEPSPQQTVESSPSPTQGTRQPLQPVAAETSATINQNPQPVETGSTSNSTQSSGRTGTASQATNTLNRLRDSLSVKPSPKASLQPSPQLQRIETLPTQLPTNNPTPTPKTSPLQLAEQRDRDTNCEANLGLWHRLLRFIGLGKIGQDTGCQSDQVKTDPSPQPSPKTEACQERQVRWWFLSWTVKDCTQPSPLPFDRLSDKHEQIDSKPSPTPSSKPSPTSSVQPSPRPSASTSNQSNDPDLIRLALKLTPEQHRDLDFEASHAATLYLYDNPDQPKQIQKNASRHVKRFGDGQPYIEWTANDISAGHQTIPSGNYCAELQFRFKVGSQTYNAGQKGQTYTTYSDQEFYQRSQGVFFYLTKSGAKQVEGKGYYDTSTLNRFCPKAR